MALSNYGEHAERAADALDTLIRGESIPTDDQDLTVLLNAREAVVSAVNDRLGNHLRANVRGVEPRPEAALTVERLNDYPVVELALAANELPRLPADQRHSPIDVLGIVPADPAAAAWVRAGSELLAANHVLDQAEDQPWRSDPAARLALITDTAQVVEAVTVLDHRLDEVGIFTGRLQVNGQVLTTPLEQREPARFSTRLLTAHLDRLGLQYGEHTLTNMAQIKPRIPDEFREPVHLVSTPGDLAPAQRQLTEFLRPAAERPHGNPHVRISAMNANTIALGHVALLQELRKRITASPDLRGQLPRVDQLKELHTDARYRLSGLHDATPNPRMHAWLRHQQQEISVAVKNGRVAQTSDQQALDLLSATEKAIGMWAAAIAREAQFKNTDLRIIRRVRVRTGEVRYRRMKKDGPAVQALTALARYRPLVPPSTNLLPIINREQLRSALARAPLGERPPNLEIKRASGPRGLGR